MQKLLILIFVLLIYPVDSSDKYGGTLHLKYNKEVQTLDPHRINVFYEDFDSSVEVINQIFEGLVSYKRRTAEIEPSLAESWDISKDGLVYTFHLRKNVFWQDGNDLFPEGKSRPVKAEDLVYSWNRLTAAETLSPMREFFSNTAKVKSWQSRGSYTFEVTLKQPNPSFLYMLPFACFSVVPEEAEQYSTDSFSAHAVGTGPFELKAWTDQISLKYNEDYWKGEPYLTEIQYRFVKSEDLLGEFEKGTLDWFMIPPELWEACAQYHVTTVPQFEILYLGMNCGKLPFLDKKVRQAISYTLDPGAAIDEIYKGRAQEAVSILPPGFVCYKQREDKYPRDLEKAIQLLEESGYTGDPRLTIELKSSESYIQQQFNNLYAEQLREIGVELKVTYVDLGSLLLAVDTGDTQLYTLGWYVDWPYPDQFLLLFHSSNWGPGGNGCFYSNKEVDQLIEGAGTEHDIQKACQLFQKAEDMILEDAVWVLQWRRVDSYAVQEWIQGFEPSGMGVKYAALDTVWISPYHRQTTRIPQKGQGEEELSIPSAVGTALLGLLVAALVLKKRKIESK